MRASEDWGSPSNLAGWTVTGASATVDCLTTYGGGCTLRLSPATASGEVRVEKTYPGFEIGGAPWYISTMFRASPSATEGQFRFNVTTNKGYFGVNFNGGPDRNQILFFSNNATSEPLATLSPGAWYHANISINAIDLRAQASIRDSNGQTVGQSRELPGPVTRLTDASTNSSSSAMARSSALGSEEEPNLIQSIAFSAMLAAGVIATPTMNFDALRLFEATPPTAPRTSSSTAHSQVAHSKPSSKPAQPTGSSR